MRKLVLILFVAPLAACSMGVVPEASQATVGLESVGAVDAVVVATYAGHAGGELDLYTDIVTEWQIGRRVIVGGSVVAKPPVPDPLEAWMLDQSSQSLVQGQRVVLMLAYEQNLPVGPWQVLYAFHWPSLNLVAARKGADLTPAAAQLARLYKPEETTSEARLGALVELVAEQADLLGARNSGNEVGAAPRSSMVFSPSTAPDPLQAFLAQPPESRSIAQEDLPPGLDWTWVDKAFVVHVDPAIEREFYGLSFATPHGVLMTLGLPTGYDALPVDTSTVVGDPVRLVLISAPGGSGDSAGEPVGEQQRTVAVIPWTEIRDHGAFRIDIGSDGAAQVAVIDAVDYEKAIESIANP